MTRTLQRRMAFYSGDETAGARSMGMVQAVLVSIVFALCFMYVPWEGLRGEEFYDRRVYLDNFFHSLPLLEEKEISGLKAFLVNEVLWDVLVRGLMEGFDLPAEAVFSGIGLLCLFCFAYFLARKHGPLAMLLLINPLVVDFAMSQLRMALAVSIVLLALFSGRRLLIAAAVIAACFIHTSIVLFMVMYLVAVRTGKWVRKADLPAPTFGYIAMAGGLLVALLIGPLREAVLTSMNDRRAEYEMAAASVSYASFWIVLLAAVPFQGKAFYRDNMNVLAVTCLSTFVFATFLGVFAARFISATMPALLSAMLTMDRPVRELAVLAYLLFLVLQWTYWLP
jgi:hypothetical protein